MQFSRDFMYQVRPKVGLPMVRLGRLFDGGYVLPKVVLERCENLISLGYGYDKSFEEDFLKISKRNRVTLYDSTINLWLVFKNLIKSCFKFIGGQNAWPPYRAKLLFNYILLLVNPRIKYKVAFVSQKSCEKSKGIDEILSKTLQSNSILKMDIEGSEYDCLKSVLFFPESIKCLIIEFHEIDVRNIEFFKIIQEIEVNFTLVNTHINNYGAIVNQVPTVLELCFVRNSMIFDVVLSPASKIPSENDFPCDPRKSEIVYEF